MLTCLLLGGFATPCVADEVVWTNDLDAALESARRSDRIVLLHFTATWCGPCRRLEQHAFKNSKVVDVLNRSAVCVKVDIDKNRKLAEQYGIVKVPADIILTADKTLVEKQYSPTVADDYLALLQKAQAKRAGTRSLVAIEPEAKASPVIKFPAIRQPRAGGVWEE